MPDAYQLSDWIGYLSRDEIDFLAVLAKSTLSNRGFRIVNIGAGAGTSGLTLRSARPDAVLYTIDVQKESTIYGGLENELNAMRENGLEDPNRHIQIHGDSKEVGANWPYDRVDMVFIDGDHSYEGARGDIEIWLKNLRHNGVIAVHDYKKHPDNKPWPGVDMAVDELLLGKYTHIGTIDTLIAFRKQPFKSE